MNVAIIGGGIAGLTAAYELSRQGHQVSLFEREPELGGQAATFEIAGGRLERFYHHLFVSDIDIIQLIEELGLGSKLLWLESRVGFCHGGRVYDFVTPLDLLRFSPLNLLDRVRLGLVSLYLQRRSRWRDLEGVTAQEWIMKWAGKRNYEVVWGPLLRGKFGKSFNEVGMVWFWGKMRLRFGSRGKGFQKEHLAYLQGSFGLVTDALAQRVGEAGGSIYTGSPVQRIRVEGGGVVGVEALLQGKEAFLPFDAVIATVSSPVFLKLVPGLPAEYAGKLRGIRYQAAACLVLALKRSLSYIYWLNISDPAIPFVAAIEHTNFIDKVNYGGRNIVYLSNYLSPDSPLYRASAEELLAEYLPYLAKINPEFKPDWVEEYHLFHEDAAQPIITTNYSAQIPEHQTPIAGLYLANTSQIYPEDRGMNYSVRLGRKVAQLAVGGREIV